ncbi:MAG: hypothetical protein QOE63_1483, partial [Acidimicrobiaceae bacterium]
MTGARATATDARSVQYLSRRFARVFEDPDRA